MSNSFKVAVLPGDAIGPEITHQAVRVFESLNQHTSHSFELMTAAFGASAYFEHGAAFPESTKRVCDQADAILKGPAGLSHEETQKIPVDQRPERGAILPLRERYDTFANIRPIFLPKSLREFSPLRQTIVGEGVDILLIRELVGGLYFGSKQKSVNADGVRYVNETLEYDERQIRRLVTIGFQHAQQRKKTLHHIHKSNVLLSSVLWQEIIDEMAPEYPDVSVTPMLVDAAATALCLNPAQFDVMVTENMFGDILSDQGGGILGSLGLMPSACLGPNKAYYEPSHGSAPDIAGKNIANPYSMIGSVAMMLEHSFGLKREAGLVWDSMIQVFDSGYTTQELGHDGDKTVLSTEGFGDQVIGELEDRLRHV